MQQQQNQIKHEHVIFKPFANIELIQQKQIADILKNK